MASGPESEVTVGRVAGIWRYPVKSMAGEALDAAEVAWHGVAGDRRWGFVRPGLERSGFPWLTLRQRADLWHFRPSYTDPGRPDESPAVVRTPAGAVLDVTDPALAAQLGPGIRVMKQDRGVFDAAPLSVLTTATLAGLAGPAGRDLDSRRFRPNLLVETPAGEPFPEEGWVGRTLRAGGVRLRVDRRDQRCVVIDVDPVTARREPGVLRAVAREREACAGVYGSTLTPGRVRVGDPVTLVG
jgi:uncharacterized protein YcbX